MLSETKAYHSLFYTGCVMSRLAGPILKISESPAESFDDVVNSINNFHPSPHVQLHALHTNSLHPHRLPCGHHTHLHASPFHIISRSTTDTLTHRTHTIYFTVPPYTTDIITVLRINFTSPLVTHTTPSIHHA